MVDKLHAGQVRWRKMLSLVEGDLICLAVKLPSESIPKGWNCSLSEAASQAMGPPRGTWQLPWMEMAEFILPSVCPTTMNTVGH